MPSIAADLKLLRQQVERLQVEVAGRQSIGAVVIWDEQNESSVNSETSCLREGFHGLVVHLTPEPSPLEGTVEGVSQNDLESLKAALVGTLDSDTGKADG